MLKQDSIQIRRIYKKKNEKHPKLSKDKVLLLNRRLKVWSGKGMAAVKADLKQINCRNVLKPQDPKYLGFDRNKKTLELHHLLGEKRDMKVKGGMVAILQSRKLHCQLLMWNLFLARLESMLKKPGK